MKNKIRMYMVYARQKLGYSQYRAAEKANLPHQHYNLIENGKVGKNIQFRTLNSISSALEIPVETLWEAEHEYQRSI